GFESPRSPHYTAPLPSHAPLAQWQSNGLLIRRFWVRIPGGAPPNEQWDVRSAALYRIATYPVDRRSTNVAGQIVQDVRHTFFKRLRRELAAEGTLAIADDLAVVGPGLVAGLERTAADHL